MKFACAWVVAMIAFSGLAVAQDTRFNFDKDADFSKYKTYKWVDIKGDNLDDLTKRQVRETFNAELAKKGLTPTESDSADLFVGYQVSLSTEKQINSFDTGYGYGPGWGAWGTGMGGMSTSTTSTLYVGALALDMYDSAKKQLVWRGVATKTLDERAKPEKRQKNLAKATAKLLKNYPPVKKS